MYWLLEGEKDEFIMTTLMGVERKFFLFFLRHVHVVKFGKVKLSFACEQLVSIGIVRDCWSLWKRIELSWLSNLPLPLEDRLLSYDSFLSFRRNSFDFSSYLLCRPFKTNKSRGNWSKLFWYSQTRNCVRNVFNPFVLHLILDNIEVGLTQSLAVAQHGAWTWMASQDGQITTKP